MATEELWWVYQVSKLQKQLFQFFFNTNKTNMVQEQTTIEQNTDTLQY